MWDGKRVPLVALGPIGCWLGGQCHGTSPSGGQTKKQVLVGPQESSSVTFRFDDHCPQGNFEAQTAERQKNCSGPLLASWWLCDGWDGPTGIKNTSTQCAWVRHIHIICLDPLRNLYGLTGAPTRAHSGPDSGTPEASKRKSAQSHAMECPAHTALLQRI